jgi:hypothetical protein
MRYSPAAVLILCLAGCGQAPAPRPEAAAPAKAVEPLKITHFYAGAAEIPAGATVGLCYGVENARAVRVEPPVEPLLPGYNRCFYTAPRRTTTYRLVAEGLDGTTATGSVTVAVKPAARPYETSAPARSLFTLTFASAPEISPGEPVTLCYGAPEAVSITVEPPVEGLKPAERYCFTVRPERTTTYTFTAHARSGTIETAALTVKVR